MGLMQRSSYVPKIAVTLIGILTGLTFYPLATQAQSVLLERAENSEDYKFVAPSFIETNKTNGRPTHRTSGGDRGPCAERLIALVPGEGEIRLQSDNCSESDFSLSKSYLALTTEEKPSLLFYVPEQSIPGLYGKLVLLEEKQRIHKQLVPLPPKAGTIAFRLTKPLEIDKEYHWIFSIVVYPRRPAKNPEVEGFIQRIEFKTSLKESASDRERIRACAKNGIWYDALAGLANLHQETPEDKNVATNWATFLSSVGLGAIADAPVRWSLPESEVSVPIAD